jgi:hypothetical protein
MSDQTTEQATAQQPQLQLADLLACIQIIQVASQRGAFKAEEFTQIGGVHDRIMGFLKASGALKTEAPADESATPAE